MDDLLRSRRSSVLSALATQNMTLKISLVVAGALLGLSTISLTILGSKKPIVVGISNNGPTVLSALNDDVSGPQVKAFIFDLLSRKFPSNPTSEKLLMVCRYFTEGLKAACEKEIKEKKSVIPQDFLIEELLWNDKTEIAKITLKRFVTFNGSISAAESTIQLKITQRSRTSENPWGLFVDGWKEEVQK